MPCAFRFAEQGYLLVEVDAANATALIKTTMAVITSVK
jgi:hypothetical protein